MIHKVDEKLHKIMLNVTRKYPLRGYILGVLTHTTTWDQIWGGNAFLKLKVHRLLFVEI